VLRVIPQREFIRADEVATALICPTVSLCSIHVSSVPHVSAEIASPLFQAAQLCFQHVVNFVLNPGLMLDDQKATDDL
jgi:hypothetical protein